MTSGGVIGKHVSASQESLTGSCAARNPASWYCKPPSPWLNAVNGANRLVSNATLVGSPVSMPHRFVELGTHQLPPRKFEPASELSASTSL